MRRKFRGAVCEVLTVGAALGAVTVALAPLPATAQSNPSGSLSMNRSFPPESSPSATATQGIQDERARLLIDRHVAWLGGWSRLDDLQSVSVSGRISVAGLEGTITMRERRDGYRRTDFDLSVVKGSDAVGADDAWSLNASGQIEDLGEDQAATTRRSIERSFGAHLRGIGVEVTSLGTEEHEQETWEVVRFRYPNGDLSDLFLADDGSTIWQREVTDTDTVWNKSSDWRTVEGLRYPFLQESIHEHAAANQTIRWETVTINQPLPDSIFERPSGRQVARVEDPSGSTPWMPIELHLDRYVYFSAQVNGQPTDVILDSGAGITVVDAATAQRLGLESTGSLPAQGVAGRTEAGIVKGLQIRLGSLVLDDLTAAVIDLSDPNRRLGRDLSVILGKEVFHNVIVEIDYPGERIRFHDPAKFRYTGQGHRVPLIPGPDGHKHLELSIEDLPPAKVALDTGSGATLSIFGAYAEENDLLKGRSPMSEHVSAGVGGTSVSTAATVRSLTFAGFKMKDVPVSFHREDVGAFATKRHAGNLGAGILARFVVFFDYPSECLWVEPVEGWDTEPFARDRSGLQTLKDDQGLEVIFVAPGSPAAESGWKAGDRIIAIDGKPIGADYFESMWEWARADDGTQARLTMANGEERTLVLRTYY